MEYRENPWFFDSNEPEDYPEGYNVCPVCGEEADEFIIVGTEVVGCDRCARRVDPADLVYERKFEE